MPVHRIGHSREQFQQIVHAGRNAAPADDNQTAQVTQGTAGSRAFKRRIGFDGRPKCCGLGVFSLDNAFQLPDALENLATGGIGDASFQVLAVCVQGLAVVAPFIKEGGQFISGRLGVKPVPVFIQDSTKVELGRPGFLQAPGCQGTVIQSRIDIRRSPVTLPVAGKGITGLPILPGVIVRRARVKAARAEIGESG
jgi:hypothetical protein